MLDLFPPLKLILLNLLYPESIYLKCLYSIWSNCTPLEISALTLHGENLMYAFLDYL